MIPREAAALFDQDKVGRPLAVAAAVAQTLLAERAGEGTDPFSRTDGWRPFGLTVRRFDFEYRGEALQAALTYAHDGGQLLLAVGRRAQPCHWCSPSSRATAARMMDLQFNGQRQTVQTWQRDELVHVFCDLGATVITEIDALAHAGEVAAEGGRLTAPMPGKVVSFAVKAGDAVKKGQAAGGDGSHENGAHHRRAGRRHGGRVAVRARAIRWLEGAELLTLAQLA